MVLTESLPLPAAQLPPGGTVLAALLVLGWVGMVCTVAGAFAGALAERRVAAPVGIVAFGLVAASLHWLEATDGAGTLMAGWAASIGTGVVLRRWAVGAGRPPLAVERADHGP